MTTPTCKANVQASAMKVVLTVAGADSGSAAGVQADLKTIAAHGAYAVAATTAVTAQDRRRVHAVHAVPAAIVAAQLRAVLDDFEVAATKSGMLAERTCVEAVAEVFQARPPPHYVLDPVLASSAGQPLLADDAVAVMVRELLPLAELVTPNIPEAERLAGCRIHTLADVRRAADVILQYGCRAVLVKGGHLASAPATDLLASAEGERVFEGEVIPAAAARGTGCAYSAAIAANRAQGLPLIEAIAAAKQYVAQAIRHGPAVGRGIGPLDHLHAVRTGNKA